MNVAPPIRRSQAKEREIHQKILPTHKVKKDQSPFMAREIHLGEANNKS